jgi:hypothetical protein
VGSSFAIAGGVPNVAGRPLSVFGAGFAAGRCAAAFGRLVRLLVGGRVLGLIVVGLAMLLGRFWP